MPDIHVYRALTDSEALRFTKMGQILNPHMPFHPSPHAARAMRVVPPDREMTYVSAIYLPEYFSALLGMGRSSWRHYFPIDFVPGTDLDVKLLSLSEAEHQHERDLFAAASGSRFFERIRATDLR